MLIDEVLPRYSFREYHSVVVDAPPELAWRAVKEMRSDEIEWMDQMFFVRRFPAKMRDRLAPTTASVAPSTPQPAATSGPPRSLVGDAVRGGFVPLGEDPGTEIVLGLVGKLWAFFGSPSLPMTSVREYLAFAEPGYARMAWNFTVRPLDDEARALVATETRTWVADDVRLRFGAYWLSIYAGSAFIRRMMLRAAASRAAVLHSAALTAKGST